MKEENKALIDLFNAANNLNNTFIKNVNYGKSYFSGEDIAALNEFCNSLSKAEKFISDLNNGDIE